MVLWDRAVLPYPFDFDTCIKVKLDSSWRIHTNFPTLSLSFQWEAWVHCYKAGATFKLDLTFLTVYVYSLI